MIVTIFRSRLRPEAVEEYTERAIQMSELVRSMPGYVSHKVFTAQDGERVTVVEFEDAEAQQNWAINAEHLRAKAKGRKSFYAEYKVQVCTVVREAHFAAKEQLGLTRL